jgi:predicted ABC-type ATPase
VRGDSGRLIVLAGVNGAGKSTVAGNLIRSAGAAFENPDVSAARLRAANPELSRESANGLAWRMSVSRLHAAIETRSVYAFETTLGGRTVPANLERATRAGIAVHVWFVGLDSVELHLARI